jgi:hypothetical protein
MYLNFEAEDGHEAFSLLIPAFTEAEEGALTGQPQVSRKVSLRK